MSHPHAELVRRGFDAFARGDEAALREVLAPDVCWHLGGRSPLAGTYKGLDEVLRLFARFGEMSAGTLRLDVHEVVAGDEHAFAAYVSTAERGGRKYRDGSVLMFHVHDGRVTEAWSMVGDQYAFDAFWA